MDEARATGTGLNIGDGTFRGPYTDEERLAMSQFVRAMRDRDGSIKNAHWREFADVVSVHQRLRRRDLVLYAD